MAFNINGLIEHSLRNWLFRSTGVFLAVALGVALGVFLGGFFLALIAINR